MKRGYGYLFSAFQKCKNTFEMTSRNAMGKRHGGQMEECKRKERELKRIGGRLIARGEAITAQL